MYDDYRNDPLYRPVLLATSDAWLALIEARLAAPHPEAARQAYDRATLVLAQLPMEHGRQGASKRFARCRWRASGADEDTGHCEHPWSKRVTKSLLWDAASAALTRGVPRARLVESFAEVLDARQDTVLLPHARVLQLGVASDRGGDGLRGRYLSAVSSGRLVLHDAASGARVDPSHVEDVEASVERRVAAALGAMAAT
jgi:hypothetical protein